MAQFKRDIARLAREMAIAFTKPADSIFLIEDILQIYAHLGLVPLGRPAHIKNRMGLHRLAIEAELGIPIKWIGTGEGEGDFAPFDAHSYISGLLA